MRLRLVLAAFSATIAACTPDPSPHSPVQRIPKSLSLQEMQGLDREVVSTSYSLEPAGRSRLGGDEVRVLVVLENLTTEAVTDPICYLFYGDRSIRLIEFDSSKVIAPGDRLRFEGSAHFPRELRGESEDIVCSSL